MKQLIGSKKNKKFQIGISGAGSIFMGIFITQLYIATLHVKKYFLLAIIIFMFALYLSTTIFFEIRDELILFSALDKRKKNIRVFLLIIYSLFFIILYTLLYGANVYLAACEIFSFLLIYIGLAKFTRLKASKNMHDNK